MYLQSHTVYLTPDGMRLEWTISPGPLLAPWEWNEADLDKDEAVSPEEVGVWLNTFRLSELSATLNEQPLPWRVAKVDWPSTYESFQLGDENVVVHLAADWPANLPQRSQLRLENRYQPTLSVNWYYLHGQEGLTFRRPQQQSGLLEVEFGAAEKGDGLTSWDSGVPAITMGGRQTDVPALAADLIGQEGEDTRPFVILTQLVQQQELSVTFFIIAFSIAVVLGALHALTPGHGKTVVAAYLVGARGTTRHAITLGSVVTLTHTGSVFAMGLVALAASQYILPTSLFPVLEVLSGLLIVGLGGYLLYLRWRDWRTGGSGHHHHDHDHEHHHHDHDQSGQAPTWHPDGQSLILPDVKEQGETFVTHLMRFDLESQQLTDLSGDAPVVDSWGVWSPDGEWLAVGRRILSGPDGSPGNQIWLMKADGSPARQLTTEADVIYEQPVWSPDGGYLLFHRYPLKISQVTPKIFLANVETGELEEVVEAGHRPTWLP
jgi:hypothetical protein